MLLALALSSPAPAQDLPTTRRTTPETTFPAPGPVAGTQAPDVPAGTAGLRIVLSYSDAKLKGVDVGGNSMVQIVGSVATAIKESGLGPTTHAALIVDVVPRYERIASDTYVAKLTVGAPSLGIDSRIAPEVQAKLQSEARAFMAKLQRWDHPMSETETRHLFGYDEKVDIALDGPFDHIKTWSYQPVSFTLVLPPPKKPMPILNYVAVEPDGERTVINKLPIGQPFWVEARYLELPQSKNPIAHLVWPGGEADVPLLPTERLLIFLSGPYYIVPSVPAAEDAAPQP